MASREPIELSCRCLAWADMCKHVAAVLYGAGATAKRAVPGTDEPANDAQGVYPPRDGDLELTDRGHSNCPRTDWQRTGYSHLEPVIPFSPLNELVGPAGPLGCKQINGLRESGKADLPSAFWEILRGLYHC